MQNDTADVLLSPGGTVRIRELSPAGFRAETVANLEISSTIGLHINTLGIRSARVLSREPHGYACVFLEPLTHDAIDAVPDPVDAVLEFKISPSDPEPFVETWSRATRLALLVGLGATCWAVVALVVG